ncbi:MAG TPA: hypothetical protein VFW07_10505 [Parafilimonas sp.]|nr:hypothetical protein [Parafilimonas sp.]
MKLLCTLFTGIVLTLYSCTPTPSIQQSWTNPEQKDSTKVFQKILLVALLKDAYTRKVAEDKLAEDVKPRGVVSYNYLPNYQANADTGLIANRLRQDGFDGIVIMRFITIDKNTVNSSPSNQPTYYNSWYGYYSTTYPLYNVPGNTAANEIYNVETNVYSLASNKLLWSGVTTAVNISNKSQMIDRIIAIVKQKMKDEGFLK